MDVLYVREVLVQANFTLTSPTLPHTGARQISKVIQ